MTTTPEVTADVSHGSRRAVPGEGGGERRLIRPRLIRRLSVALTTGIALIHGPHGAGKDTLVRTWARRAGAELVWFDAAHAGAATWETLTLALQRTSPPVVAVLRGRAIQDGAVLAELRRLQARHPALSVVLLRGLGMSLTASDPELPSVSVVTAKDLAFTTSEIVQLGDLVGVRVDERTARAVHEHTGGYALAVDALVQAMRGTGRITEPLLEETADLLMGVAAEGSASGAVSAAGWQRMLRTAIPESLSFAQVGWIWGTAEPERVVQLLDGSGLAHVVETDGGPRVLLVSALRSGLRRRSRIDFTRPQLEAAVTEMAQWLDEHGDLSGAASLLHEYGLSEQLGEWARRRWQELPRLSAGLVRDVLRTLTRTEQRDPRLLAAHARVLVDVFQHGHDGNVRARDRRSASLLLERAAGQDRELDDPAVETAIVGVQAVLARAAGDHERAAALHARAVALAEAADSASLGSWQQGQAALTSLSTGDLHGAARELGRALDLRSGDWAESGHLLLSELDRLTLGYLGTLHPDDDGEQDGPRALDGLAGSVRALAETSRMIAQLQVASAWELLDQIPTATGSEDPAVLLALRAQAEAMAHVLAGTPVAGLGALDVVDALLHTRRLSAFEATLLRNTRAELLVAVGEPEEALAVLDDAEAPTGLASILVRCVVLLALGQPREAAALVGPLLPTSSRWAETYPTWMLLVSSLVFADIGDTARADQLLGRGVAIAARSGAMLPFARQGQERMVQLIERARELRLDPGSRALLDQLEEAREHLRLSSVQARLSARELVVLHRLRETGATRRLAALLHVSPNTVKSQLQSIYRKLGASTRAEALRAAALLGLLDDSSVQRSS
ncbi:helix-turn-helix transcriptional regulator [Pseudactinotalea sp.]|uniref:helix-turn-helix transcriptional regulator n=1 Tax=Pseudactinotalea sp. TaxID=1926260 RepID=UPI003B3B9818